MTDTHRTPSVETLLAERAWVEGLARSLVRDAATADDVVQQTWLAAITRPPREPGALRGWLSRVVRNKASESRRGEARRERWEGAARAEGGGVHAEGADEVVAKAEILRRVVDAVMGLDEPYRTAILLKFFEGLEATEVAARTGVPAETARTRIKRGLARLRERLDAESGGDGRAWALALIPLAGPPEGFGVGETAAAAAAGGVIVASLKTWAAAALVGAILGAFVTAGVMGGAPQGKGGAEVAEAGRVAGGGTGGGGGAARSEGVGGATKRGAGPGAPSGTTDAAAPGAAIAAGGEALLRAAGDAIDLPPKAPRPITGRVTTKDGAPVAGAVVRLWAQRNSDRPPARRGTIPPVPDAATRRADTVRAMAFDEATRREAVTDADGRYSIGDLYEATYHASAFASGFDVRVGPRGSSSSKPGGTVDFVASAIAVVPVSVRMADGSAPPDRVLVRWAIPDGGGGGGSAWWEPADPVVVMEPGKWELRAEMGKSARSEAVAAVVKTGEANAPLSLTLAVIDTLTGTVRFDPSDDSWDDADVSVHRRGAVNLAAPLHRGSVRSPDFRFRFEGVEPGEYELVASAGQFTEFARAPVTIVPGAVTKDIDVPRLGPDKVLLVRVTGPDGNPVGSRGVSFGVDIVYHGGVSAIGLRGESKGDGLFRVPVPTGQGLGNPGRDAAYRLELRHEKFGTRAAPFTPGVTRDLRFSFQASAEFEPVFVGCDDTSVRRRLRAILMLLEQPMRDALNSNLEKSVEPGRYAVALWLQAPEGAAHEGRVLTRTLVDLRSGSNSVELRVPALYTVRIRHPAGTQGVEVTFSAARLPRDAGSMPTVVTDESGRVTIPDVPTGKYSAVIHAGGEAREMILDVSGSGEFEFVQTSLAGFEVTIDDRSAGLATAGLETGDLLTEMDGARIDSMNRMRTLLYAARHRTSATLAVLRGGRRVELTTDPKHLVAEPLYGGRLDAVLR